MSLLDAIAGIFGYERKRRDEHDDVFGSERRPHASAAGGTALSETIAMSAGTLRVETESGNVVVQGWDQDVVRVEARTPEPGLRIAYARGGDVIRLHGLARGDEIEEDDVDYIIFVPKGVQLDVRTDSGDIVGRETGATFRAESVCGDVAVKEQRGPLTVRTESGNVAVAGPAADVDAQSECGNVTVRLSAATPVRVVIRTESGDIDATGLTGTTLLESESGRVSASSVALRADDSLTVRTGCGDQTLSIPPTMPASIEVLSESGRFTTDLDIATDFGGEAGVQVSERRHGGGAEVALSTESGDIALHAR